MELNFIIPLSFAGLPLSLSGTESPSCHSLQKGALPLISHIFLCKFQSELFFCQAFPSLNFNCVFIWRVSILKIKYGFRIIKRYSPLNLLYTFYVIIFSYWSFTSQMGFLLFFYSYRCKLYLPFSPISICQFWFLANLQPYSNCQFSWQSHALSIETLRKLDWHACSSGSNGYGCVSDKKESILHS